MRIVSFRTATGQSYGIVADAGVIDLGRLYPCHYPTLRAALAANALDRVVADAKDAGPALQLDELTFLPPIPEPDKIVCIGLNYRAHAAEVGRGVPEHPSLFLRLANTLVPDEGPIIRPRLSTSLDYEGELALIIGRGGRHITQSDALKHVAGYACFNDASVRDYQFEHSLAVGKNFAGTGGFGPWMVSADEIPDPARLTIRTRLNGAEVQHSTTDDLIFSVPWLIAYVSGFTELLAGDVIVTGTPQGVGFARNPQLWMQPGDVVEVEISSIGTLRNNVVQEGS